MLRRLDIALIVTRPGPPYNRRWGIERSENRSWEKRRWTLQLGLIHFTLEFGAA